MILKTDKWKNSSNSSNSIKTDKWYFRIGTRIINSLKTDKWFSSINGFPFVILKTDKWSFTSNTPTPSVSYHYLLAVCNNEVYYLNNG